MPSTLFELLIDGSRYFLHKDKTTDKAIISHYFSSTGAADNVQIHCHKRRCDSSCKR